MGRARDIANVLSSSTNIALDSEVALIPITPTSIATTGGSGSISATGAVSFTSASAISLNGCFTSSYNNYRLVFTAIGSTFAGCYLRTRLSGTDATGANYSFQRLGGAGSTSAIVSRATSQTLIELGYLRSGGSSGWTVDIFSPNLAEPTKTISSNTDWADGTNLELYLGAGFHFISTAYDGFTLLPNTGTFTGTLRVYGYRN